MISGELPRRNKPRTSPPPPPGSPLRQTQPPPTAGAAASSVPAPPILPTAPAPAPAAAPTHTERRLPLPPPDATPPRSKPPSSPPPPPARTKPPSRPPPPPLPVGDEGELTIPNSPEVALGLPPPPTLQDSGFDEIQKTVKAEDNPVMRRLLEATPIPGPELRPVARGGGADIGRDDPTIVPTGDDSRPPGMRGDPSQITTDRFERADPTEPPSDRTDATIVHTGRPAALTGTINLRPEASLPRRRGPFGDMRYIFTVLFGVARARREVAAIEIVLAREKAERKERLVALGRAAVVSEKFAHPAMGPAREQLGTIEEERSRFAGQVAAADSELEHVKRERGKRSKQSAEEVSQLAADIAAIDKKLEPLEREALLARRRAADHKEQMAKIDARIAATEASLVSVKVAREDKPAIMAEIASLKADRESVRRDEPVIASQLDGLAPKIAALEATRDEKRRKLGELREREDDDQRRAQDLITAISAKRVVVERAQLDAETARDKALFGLAERLLIDRPSQLGRAFEPIDDIDLAIATRERRAMELREVLGSVDKGALVRGIAVMLVILGAAAAGVILALNQ